MTLTADIRRAVQSANAEFYRAFAQQDFPAMATLWAKRHPVSCTHPGWPPLIGLDAVLASWRDVLAVPQALDIRPENVRVLDMGNGSALALCAEVLNGRAVLAAGNLFILEDGEWRLTFHQAGQVAAPVEDAAPRTAAPIMH